MIKALIAVRSDSERVTNKNLRPFAGSTLLEVKIRQLLRIPELDGIVVNSNSDEMLDIARRHGVEAVRRDDYFASSTVSINEVYVDIARHFDADVMVYANCTNPLIEDASISGAIRAFREMSPEYDSLNTVHPVRDFLWLDGKAVNYDPAKMPKSQDLPDVVALNFAVNVIRREDILRSRSVVGLKPFLYPIGLVEAVDIDNEIDFDFAEYVYRKRSTP